MPKIHSVFASVAAAFLFCALPSRADSVSLPNASFEAPPTTFADPHVDQWQKTPKPVWYDESSGFFWDQLSGVFKNTDAGSADHIDNVDGSQALFLFGVPTAGIFQDFASTDYAGNTHQFNATFTAGKSYRMTVGIAGGGANMPEGSSLQLSFYYRDTSGNQVPIATKDVVYTAATFPNLTHLIDFSLDLPEVKASDAFAGKNIGVLIMSTTGFDKTGGYWDLDNVRLTETIDVPNFSFESPQTDFADPQVDAWQKFPKPDWYDESGGFLWTQLSGVFKNTAPGQSDHIDNVDQNQALFLFGVPQNGLFQTLDATYEIGHTYSVTAGFAGGGANMPEGSTLLLALYYVDAGNFVQIATTPITYTHAAFPNLTHLIDMSANSALVKPTDAWAGKNIGVMLMAVPTQETSGGYWDLDNVRLSSSVPSSTFSVAVSLAGANAHLSWPSNAGWQYQVKVSEDLATWSDVDTSITGTGGELTKDVALAAHPHAFFIVRATPTP
jgi:hypothetical protein